MSKLKNMRQNSYEKGKEKSFRQKKQLCERLEAENYLG